MGLVVNGRGPRRKPNFVLMDGVKQVLGRRDIGVEVTRERVMDRRLVGKRGGHGWRWARQL